MALFFDAGWFDAALARLHVRRADLGALLGMTAEEIGEVFKDQRELKAADVAVIAAFLNVRPEEVAARAGVSTPVPRPSAPQNLEARLEALEARLAALEARLKP